MSSNDPFSLVYDAIFDLLEAWPPFVDEFKLNNLIRLDDADDDNRRDPIKQNINVADLPEAILIPAGGNGNLTASSSHVEWFQNYDLMISTGLKLQDTASRLKWFALQALARWKTAGVGAVAYGGQNFTMDIFADSNAEGLSDPEANRGIVGFSNVMTFRVRLEFSNAQMIYQET